MKKFVLGACASVAALLATSVSASAATPLTVSYNGSVFGVNGGPFGPAPTTFTGETTLEDANDGAFSFSSFNILFGGTVYTLADATAAFNGLGQLELFTGGTRFTSFQFTGSTAFAADGTNYPVALVAGDTFTVSPNIGPVQILGGVGNASGITASGAVPEPATWAMMLVGFGGLGYSLRRRRKAEARIRFA